MIGIFSIPILMLLVKKKELKNLFLIGKNKIAYLNYFISNSTLITLILALIYVNRNGY